MRPGWDRSATNSQWQFSACWWMRHLCVNVTQKSNKHNCSNCRNSLCDKYLHKCLLYDFHLTALCHGQIHWQKGYARRHRNTTCALQRRKTRLKQFLKMFWGTPRDDKRHKPMKWDSGQSALQRILPSVQLVQHAGFLKSYITLTHTKENSQHPWNDPRNRNRD